MLGIRPVGRFDLVGPELDRRHVMVERVAGDLVLLAVLDRYTDPIPREIVVENPRVVTVSAPHAVVRSLGAVPCKDVPAERGLDAVRRGKAEIVLVEQIVVRAALAGIHRLLAG